LKIIDLELIPEMEKIRASFYFANEQTSLGCILQN